MQIYEILYLKTKFSGEVWYENAIFGYECFGISGMPMKSYLKQRFGVRCCAEVSSVVVMNDERRSAEKKGHNVHLIIRVFEKKRLAFCKNFTKLNDVLNVCGA